MVEITILPFVLQFDRKLHPECEWLKATERAPWTIDASVCNHEAAMAAFTWPRLGRGLLCFCAVWREPDAYATPIALLSIFLMPVAGEEELAVLNSFGQNKHYRKTEREKTQVLHQSRIANCSPNPVFQQCLSCKTQDSPTTHSQKKTLEKTHTKLTTKNPRECPQFFFHKTNFQQPSTKPQIREAMKAAKWVKMPNAEEQSAKTLGQ